VENIIADIASLGLRYEKLSYTSDYFPQMLDLAERLIKAGHLYADDTPVDKMREVSFAFRANPFRRVMHPYARHFSNASAVSCRGSLVGLKYLPVPCISSAKGEVMRRVSCFGLQWNPVPCYFQMSA
jgi:hypothetical protein